MKHIISGTIICLSIILEASVLGQNSENNPSTANDKHLNAEIALKLARQNLRPISSVMLEYTIETSDETGTEWLLTERHRLIQDFKTGKYLDKVVLRNGNSKESILYREESWNGTRGLYVDKYMPYSNSLDFSSDVRGKGVGSLYPMKPQRPHPIFSLFELDNYDGKKVFEILDQNSPKFSELVRIVGVEGDSLRIRIGNETEFLIDSSLGSIKDRVDYGGLPKDGSAFEYIKTTVLKSEYLDGWNFPTEVVKVNRDAFGKFVSKVRLKVLPGSLKINTLSDDTVFNTALPLGAQITDSISQTIYTVTGFETSEKRGERISDQLDRLLGSESK